MSTAADRYPECEFPPGTVGAYKRNGHWFLVQTYLTYEKKSWWANSRGLFMKADFDDEPTEKFIILEIPKPGDPDPMSPAGVKI
jgi:hypothetical protein